MREGERAVALAPIEKDAWYGAETLNILMRIQLALGNPEKALDVLERLLNAPGTYTRAQARIDPGFKALRGNPRFDGLTKG